MANNEVSFDELPEFKRKVLEVLDKSLEDREVTISRTKGSVTYPSNIFSKFIILLKLVNFENYKNMDSYNSVQHLG